MEVCWHTYRAEDEIVFNASTCQLIHSTIRQHKTQRFIPTSKRDISLYVRKKTPRGSCRFAICFIQKNFSVVLSSFTLGCETSNRSFICFACHRPDVIIILVAWICGIPLLSTIRSTHSPFTGTNYYANRKTLRQSTNHKTFANSISAGTKKVLRAN